MKSTKKVLPIIASAIAALATSCSSDALGTTDGSQQPSGSAETKTVTLTASIGSEPTTRVGMTKKDDNKVSFFWHNGDGIYVQTKKKDGTYTGASFYTDAETGSTTATFTGKIGENDILDHYAVSPYRMESGDDGSDKPTYNHRFNSATELIFNLPDNYVYPVSSTVFDAKTVNSDTDIPLIGYLDDTGNIEFHHLGGLGVIYVDKMPAASGTITVSADQQLAGDFEVDLSAETPVMTTTKGSDGNNEVTFYYNNATTGSVGVIYLPMATGSYSNLTIKIQESGSSEVKTVKYGNLYVARASVNALPIYNHNGTFEKFKEVSDNTYKKNGYEFVDLGLPSGLLWATKNVSDANGQYFAWGEIASGKSAGWSKYNYYKDNAVTKYNNTDGKTTLEAEDDAATRIIGTGVRMPSKADFEELMNSQNCTWTADIKSSGNKVTINGYKVTSKNNNNSIYLAADGGYIVNAQVDITSDLIQLYSYCYYWTSTMYASKSAYTMRASSAVQEFWEYSPRPSLFPIRAVAEH